MDAILLLGQVRASHLLQHGIERPRLEADDQVQHVGRRELLHGLHDQAEWIGAARKHRAHVEIADPIEAAIA
ncbi:MAG: hypothetical protein U1E76_17615 [Planctomycetota bacterium]